MAERLQLNDEELNKVSGGIKYYVSEVNALDVFLYKGSSTMGLIIICDTAIENENTAVSFKDICKNESGWSVASLVQQKPISYILNIAEYSKELSKTIFC